MIKIALMKTLAYFVGAVVVVVVGDGDQFTLFYRKSKEERYTTMKRNLYFLSNNEAMGGIQFSNFGDKWLMFLQSPIFNDTAKESRKTTKKTTTIIMFAL